MIMERIAFNQIPSGMVEKLMAIENYLKETKLEFSLLELIRLRTAQINRCAYCVDMHHKELKNCGESELRISMLPVWRETPFFNDREKTVLELVEILTTISKTDITDELYNSLQSHFSTEDICNLTFAITQINTWTRLVRICQFEPGNYEVKN